MWNNRSCRRKIGSPLDNVGFRQASQYDYAETLLNRVGHGIGYMIHEAPDIKQCNHRKLERGMAFSIEPGVYFEGKFDKPSLQKIDKFLIQKLNLNNNDKVIFTGSVPELLLGGTNFIKIHKIGSAG